MRSFSGISIMIFYLILIASGQVFARYGALAAAADGSGNLNIFHLFSYLFLFLRAPLWLFVLKKYELSTAYPVISFSYVIILFLSMMLFNETLTPGKTAGAVMITAGILLISSAGKKADE